MLVTPHLKLWLPMEGNANDASGNGNNGTVTGASLTTGKFGQCYSFDRTDDIIYIPDSSSLSITGDITIALWMKILGSVGTWRQVVNKIIESDGTTSFSYEFILTDADKMRFGVSSDGNYPGTYGTQSTAFNTNTWYFTAVTYGASAGTCQFYLNGNLDGSGSGLPTSIYDGTAELAVGGQRSSSPANCFDGLIENVMIFNNALSQSDIKRIMLGMHPLNG